jgi:hypothetical protein
MVWRWRQSHLCRIKLEGQRYLQLIFFCSHTFFPAYLATGQDDQIERIFGYWATVNFGCGVKITAVEQLFGLHFPWYQLCMDFDKKSGWATF